MTFALVTESYKFLFSSQDKYMQVSQDKYLPRYPSIYPPKFPLSLICHLVCCIRNVMNLQRQRTVPRFLALVNDGSRHAGGSVED